ncbi:MAG: glycosyltransferase family 2 protein [Verrucomicrobia bacterium]|nr:glycosyltransferase family 2 protein [Verrucomicrobiota bacterium]
MPPIKLLSVMGSASARLVPFFIAHYRAFGIERFCITLHVDAGQETDRDLALGHMRDAGITPLHIWEGPFDHGRKEQRLAEMRAEQNKGADWWVYADTDEFHEFPVRPSALRKLCLRHGKCYVMGRWVDRLADGGGLPVIDPGIDLHRQFPWATHLSQSLGGKSFDATTKLCLVGPDVHPSNSGFHRPRGRNWREDPERWPGLMACNHFKWDESVKHRLKRRVTEWSEVQNSVQEARNLEDHLLANNGAIDLESVVPRQRQRDGSSALRAWLRMRRYSRYFLQANLMGRTVEALSGQDDALAHPNGVYR